MRKGLALLLILFCSATSYSAPKNPKAVFIPMDYSTCGYKGSDMPIPNVKTVIYVSAVDGDCTERLQRAVDYVASLPEDKDGFRGCLLLGTGTFAISKPLRITSSGVVIRGVDKNKTILKKNGVDRGAAIYIEGGADMIVTDTLPIMDDVVKAGCTVFRVSSGNGKIKKNDMVRIFRPSTKEWIASLGCEDFGGELDYTGWKPSDVDITWDRKVVAVDGEQITVDAPLTTSISQRWGGGMLLLYRWNGRISNCGVENMTIVSDFHSYNMKDEDHCWDGIDIDNARDCWVRRLSFARLAGSAVLLQRNTSRITVEDCIADEPISEIGGWRRRVFLTRGQQTLFQRCISRHGIHDFAAGYAASGPNAFVQCEGEESLGFSGSVGSWSAGLLFDIVNIDGNDIKFCNLEQDQFGTGWNTANSMLWQCTAAEILCYSPSPDDKCGANGCWGTLQGNGEWTESNNHVTPRSLFYEQLQKRNGDRALKGFVLPRNTDASSSPTIEEAAAMAHEALTQPRLTLEMWQDSVPYTASTRIQGVKSIDKIKSLSKTVKDEKCEFSIVNGKLVCNGSLIVGGHYDIPWWAGRSKDNYLLEARPAVTRFIPGYEYDGATDRIDSVVDFMAKKHFAVLEHHYGLWYDLRRIDHERVRRIDGDVEPPFYEQPFARSGQGTAWDGLSKYDLTKPNLWYWQRLKDFADKASSRGILLFHNDYFQHNILEAGAHWVDCPWRTVNNINNTHFPEPVPFTGDKRIFMADYFYNENDSIRRELHRGYIRQCLDNFRDNENVVQLISAEYTGPYHFTRFWLETIAEWEAETGRHPMIALCCTKDVQDSILQDSRLSKVVDIIDISYWHYNTSGLWAPKGGQNLAPRQHMRKMRVGVTRNAEAYQAVEEYRNRYPDKVVTYYSQAYPSYGWAIFMAGGSCPDIKVKNDRFLTDAVSMKIIPTGNENLYELGDDNKGYIFYSGVAQTIQVNAADGVYHLWKVDTATGDMKTIQGKMNIKGSCYFAADGGGSVYWLQKIHIE